ncbi:hypothetical protein HDU76_010629 [Blyttiomyces sp. JEL0837]|nr:hypothetical protein HDU76_010629 [Blyttiomyces sp. JEL0837]
MFLQDPPQLQNQFDDDVVLQTVLKKIVPQAVLDDVVADLRRFGGKVVSSEVMGYCADAMSNLPRLEQYDAWGKRIDVLHTAHGWKKMKEISAEEGLISIAYERRQKEFSRVYQFAKLYLFAPSAAVYTCPLAMTDGAARLIETNDDQELKNTAYRHLTSRDPKKFWTSGQWMTERPGGSDIGRTESNARPVPGTENQWLIDGFKWFSSATDAEMTLLLARETDAEGKNGAPGSRGLSLFYSRVRNDDGALNGIKVVRLKNKYGTKPLPTAELDLAGMKAKRVGAPLRGVANISVILNITRLHAAINVAASFRRALAIAKDFALRREAFGKPLWKQPLHIRTLSDLETSLRAVTYSVFHVIHLLGLSECPPANLTPADRASNEVLLRILTPVIKAWSAKTCVAGLLECLHLLLFGTTNVLALDLVRVMKGTRGTAYKVLIKSLECKLDNQPTLTAGSNEALTSATQSLRAQLKSLDHLATQATTVDESLARGLLFATGRCLAATLMLEQAALSGAQVDVIAAVRWVTRMQSGVGLDFGFGFGGVGEGSVQEDESIFLAKM